MQFRIKVEIDINRLSDRILAASIGCFIGKVVVKFDDDSSERNLSFSSYYIPNGAGINFV